MANRKKKSKPVTLVSNFVQGRWISTSFLLKNAIFIIAAISFLMIYISNKYKVQTKIETVQALEQELERVKTESMRERSNYMSRTRESSMQIMIDTLHLDLQIREQPPFKITY